MTLLRSFCSYSLVQFTNRGDVVQSKYTSSSGRSCFDSNHKESKIMELNLMELNKIKCEYRLNCIFRTSKICIALEGHFASFSFGNAARLERFFDRWTSPEITYAVCDWFAYKLCRMKRQQHLISNASSNIA